MDGDYLYGKPIKDIGIFTLVAFLNKILSNQNPCNYLDEQLVVEAEIRRRDNNSKAVPSLIAQRDRLVDALRDLAGDVVKAYPYTYRTSKLVPFHPVEHHVWRCPYCEMHAQQAMDIRHKDDCSWARAKAMIAEMEEQVKT